MSTKTPAQIENLKDQWRADPAWDIEDTEGFEAHRDELLVYRREMESAWIAAGKERARKELARLKERAALFGCSIELVKHIEALEARVQHLENRMDMRL